MSSSRDVAAAIRAIRSRLCLNQTDFAVVLGSRQKTISQYESGLVRPSPPQIIKLLSLTGRPPDSHPSESGPLISVLAEQLGLSEGGVIMLIGHDQADLLAAMAAKRNELDAMGADLKARRLELDQEEIALQQPFREVKGE